MLKINEPFRESSRDEEVLDKSGKPIPIFSSSRFSNCDWNHYADLIPELKKPITDDLSKIFDLGNEVHLDDNYLSEGARNILGREEYMRIVHESETWGISGLLDYDKFNFSSGKYIEDMKSTKIGGFFFFLKEKVKPEDKGQMSIYAYMKYVITGTKRYKGVIRKIDKEEPLNQLQLVTDLFDIEYIRNFLIDHPVKKTILGHMTPEKLAEQCAKKMRPEINKSTGEHWRCLNCTYADGSCPVRQQI